MKDEEKEVYRRYVSILFGFSHDTENIEEEYRRTFYWWKEHLFKFIKHMDKNIKILDIGCGLGHNLFVFKELGFKNVVGVDISPECIDFCKKKKFNVIQKDVFDFLKENKTKFNLITAFDIVEHFSVEEASKLVRLVFQNLEDEGIFIVNVQNANNPFTLRERYIDITHKTIYTPESLSELLRIGGFIDIKIIGVKPFSTIHGVVLQKIFRKCIALPIYKSSLFFLKLWYLSQGFLKVQILDERIVAIGRKTKTSFWK